MQHIIEVFGSYLYFCAEESNTDIISLMFKRQHLIESRTLW
jgi:hypothetical protein